jgi:origin recognition complex subunit 3
MCHFYANPLSILGNVDTPNESILQPEHYQAIRNLPSFRSNIETLVESGTTDALQRAKSLIEDDGFLASQVQEITSQRTEWMGNLLRSLLVATSAGALNNSLCKEYINASSEGISFADMPHLVNSIRRLDASHLVTMLQRVVSLLADGDNSFALSPATNTGDAQLQIPLKEQLAKLEELIETTGDDGSSLRSKYNGQSRLCEQRSLRRKYNSAKIQHHSVTRTDSLLELSTR